MEPRLSIIIPVFNEEHLLAESLPAIFQLPINKEVIVIDDCSNDGSPAILKEMLAQYDFKLLRQEPNQGKGAAVKRGLSEMSGDFFVICDADLEYEADDITLLFNAAKQAKNKKTAIYGSRFLNNPPLSFHYLVNSFLTGLTNILYGSRLSDMETCFKLVPAAALEKIRLEAQRFEIEPEITAGLLQSGYEIKELPIRYRRRTYQEGKKIKAIDGFLAVKALLKRRFRR